MKLDSAGDQHTQDLCAHVIQPPLARLMRERQPAEALHELVGRARKRPGAQRQASVDERVLERGPRREERDFAVPRAIRQQVAYGDRARRGHRVVQLAVDGPQDLPVRELRQEGVDGVVEPQRAFLDENHRRHRRDRLRHRGQAKNRIAPHRRRAVERQGADCVDVLGAPAADERDEAGQSTAVHVATQDVVYPRQPRGRESIALRPLRGGEVRGLRRRAGPGWF
jgi:hypothetical protein